MGIGTQEIVNSCVDVGMKEPEFYEQAGTFVLRLWSRHYTNTTPAISPTQSNLTDRQIAILDILKDKKLAPQDILISLEEDITDRTLRRDLQTLKDQGYINSEGQLGPKTLWFLKAGTLYGVTTPTINEHLKNIYKDNELDKNSTIRKFRIVQSEGEREIAREVEHYNLDVIIAVGYRVNSHRATQFRQWAAEQLKNYIIKGYILDKERLLF